MPFRLVGSGSGVSEIGTAEDLVDAQAVQPFGELMDLVLADHPDVSPVDGAKYQGTVGRQDELELGKRLRQPRDDDPLPLRVQVQVDVVDHHHAGLIGERYSFFAIIDMENDITDQPNIRTIAVRHGGEREFDTSLAEDGLLIGEELARKPRPDRQTSCSAA